MKTKNQVIFVAIFFSLAIVFTVFFVKPYVNYEGSVNGTMSSYGTVHALIYDTVPTIINGISTVTSIIIGFSGAIIGLVYREDFKKSKIVKVFLLLIAFFSIFPVSLLIAVYSALFYGALEYALKFALIALYVALFDFTITMIIIFHFYVPNLDKDIENPFIGDDF